jgi:hypothetical protein
MAQAPGGFSFGLKPFHKGSAGERAGQHHLERDNAVQPSLSGPIDHAHPAAGNLLEQFVVAECSRPRPGVRRRNAPPGRSILSWRACAHGWPRERPLEPFGQHAFRAQADRTNVRQPGPAFRAGAHRHSNINLDYTPRRERLQNIPHPSSLDILPSSLSRLVADGLHEKPQLLIHVLRPCDGLGDFLT